MRISRYGGKEVIVEIEGKKQKKVRSFKYLSGKITNDEKYEIEIKSRITIAKDAFNKGKKLLKKTIIRNF